MNNPQQQKACFHYTNLRPLWAKENLSKGSKIIVDTRKEQCDCDNVEKPITAQIQPEGDKT
jgi:lipopolysaccharide export system protein LptA